MSGGRAAPAGVVRAALLTLASSGALLTVMAVHVAQGLAPTGPRISAIHNVTEVAVQLPSLAGLLISNGLIRSTVLGALVLTTLVILGTASLLAGRRPNYGLVIATTWLGIYLAFLILTVLQTAVDAIDYRLSSPALPTVFALSVAVLSTLVGMGRAALVAGVIGSAHLAISMVWTANFAPPAPPLEPSGPRAHDLAELVAATVPADGVIVSDMPFEVVRVTRRDLVVGFPDAGPSPEGRPRWVFASSLGWARPGDYALWAPGLRHDVRAYADSKLLTVRWCAADGLGQTGE